MLSVTDFKELCEILFGRHENEDGLTIYVYTYITISRY